MFLISDSSYCAQRPRYGSCALAARRGTVMVVHKQPGCLHHQGRVVWREFDTSMCKISYEVSPDVREYEMDCNRRATTHLACICCCRFCTKTAGQQELSKVIRNMC